MGRKGFITPQLIALIIVLLGGTLVLFLVKFNPSEINLNQDRNIDIKSPEARSQTTVPATNSPSPKPSPDLGSSENSEIQGWKIYKNNTYNFSFQYPDSWILEANDSTGGTHPFLDIHLSNSKPTDNLIKQCTPSYAGMEIQVGHWRSNELIFNNFVKNNTSPEAKGLNPGGKLEQLSIDGNSTYKVERSGWDTACTGPGYFIDQDENTYTYIFTGSGSAANSGILDKVVNSIKYN